MANPAKNRGDRYERELAQYFNKTLAGVLLGQASRSVMSGGGSQNSLFDLTGVRFQMPRITGNQARPVIEETLELGVEAKRTERLNVREALRQNETHMTSLRRRGCDTSGMIPIVVSRCDKERTKDSVVAMRLSDFVALIGGAAI